jgi:hypothetical protein
MLAAITNLVWLAARESEVGVVVNLETNRMLISINKMLKATYGIARSRKGILETIRLVKHLDDSVKAERLTGRSLQPKYA